MIFISYRRNDEPGYAGRVADGLRERFGSEQVFLDIDDIAMGHDWRDQIETSIGRSAVVLIIIGQHWKSELLNRRDSSKEDVHQYELVTAHTQGKPIVPVLLPGATLPQKDELDELNWLSDLQLFTMRDGQKQWPADIEMLSNGIEELSPLRAHRSRFSQRSPVVISVAIAALLLGTFAAVRSFSTDNRSEPDTHSFASDFAMPLGQLAHDWSDADGVVIALDAPADSAHFHYLNNLKFPAARGTQGDLIATFCQQNSSCIACTASPSEKTVQDAELISIRFTAAQPPVEEEMITADQKNIWPIKDNYMPWENIDNTTGKRTLYVCTGDKTQ